MPLLKKKQPWIIFLSFAPRRNFRHREFFCSFFPGKDVFFVSPEGKIFFPFPERNFSHIRKGNFSSIFWRELFLIFTKKTFFRENCRKNSDGCTLSNARLRNANERVWCPFFKKLNLFIFNQSGHLLPASPKT